MAACSNSWAPSWATRSRATARSAPPANTSSICACSRSHGDTLFGTDVGSFLSWLDHLREEPTSVPFYTDRETRPAAASTTPSPQSTDQSQGIHASCIAGQTMAGMARRRSSHSDQDLGWYTPILTVAQREDVVRHAQAHVPQLPGSSGPPAEIGVRWLPVPAGGDRARSALVPPLRTLVSRC